MPHEKPCTLEQQVRVTANPTTPAGNPAELDEPLHGDPIQGTGEVLPGANDKEVICRPTSLGDVVFLIKGDADLGEGVVEISDTLTLHVSNPMAQSLGMTVSEPEAIPVPVP